MKRLLITFICIGYVTAYAQKKGYRELQIGASVEVIFKNFYLFEGVEKDNDGNVTKYIVNSPKFQICEKPVEYVAVNVGVDGLISQIQVVTKEIQTNDFSDYIDKIERFSSCLISNVGKPRDVDTESEKISMGWDFKEEGITFALFCINMSSFAKNEKRRFSLIWAKNTRANIWGN